MKILRRMALYLRMIYETWFNHLLLSVVVAAMMVCAVYAISMYDEYYGVIRAAKNHRMQDKIVIYNHDAINNPFDVSIEYTMDYLERARSVEGVKSAYYLGDMGTNVNDKNSGLRFSLDDCSSLINSGYQFEVTEGRNPNPGSYNEVLINSAAAKKYSVGDVITIDDWIFSKECYYEPDDCYYMNGVGIRGAYDISFTVVGIIDDDAWFVSGESRTYPPVISDVIFLLSEDLNRGVEGEPIIYTGSIKESSGKTIVLTSYSTVFITLEDGADPATVKAELEDTIGHFDSIITYDDYINNYDQLSSSLRNTIIKYAISFCLLSFMILSAVIFTKFQKRKEEIHSYYLCGQTWNWCILSSIKMFIPALILGTIMGGVVLIIGKDSFLYCIDDKYINVGTLSEVLLLYIIMIVIVMIPVFFSLRNKSLNEFKGE